jgi:hypothetical protein
MRDERLLHRASLVQLMAVLTTTGWRRWLESVAEMIDTLIQTRNRHTDFY